VKGTFHVTAEVASESQFTITYDGPALASGRMPVHHLAPAMVGVADLIEKGSAVL
jgi:hypothetical protein